MKAFAGLFNSLIVGSWIFAIAIFSIQNIQNVSVKFLMFESITIPVGILLALCSAIGMILGWLLPLLFARKKASSRNY
ncbi:LapA family protein [Waterburya agarophytonicola K14]|uniref:LapA family protein n=1 Tax=Waterburya agarophytonicola KI4 TaxID=2874699 RepID=A0A964FGH2_9CYAN|nr:LapA family protein [Waterburya agarophytonicola]MCC0178016.1 LapA family protein [Waterburya agarophytonicola KI4]